MKLELVNKLTSEVIYSVDVSTDEVNIYDPMLKKIMQKNGVTIPVSEQERFQGRSSIRFGEPDFHIAFYKFCSAEMSLDEFYWRTSL